MTLGRFRGKLRRIPEGLRKRRVAGLSELYYIRYKLDLPNVSKIMEFILERNPDAAVKLLMEEPLTKPEKKFVKRTLCTFRKEGK